MNSKCMGSQDFAGIAGNSPCTIIISLIVFTVQDNTGV